MRRATDRMFGHALELARDLAKSMVRRRAPVDAGELVRRTPVSSRFGTERGTAIDRHYIAGFLAAHAPRITGDVLEIGGSRYARRFGKAIRRLDVLHATAELREATIVGDLCVPASLPEATFDCVICTQTLNFIFDVPAAIAGLARLVRPGGHVLATMAGISQISRYDMERWGDYWRFTDASARRLFAEPFAADVETFGNVAAAIALLQGLALEDLPDRSVLDARDADYPVIVGVAAARRR